jgi:hypothetical protein
MKKQSKRLEPTNSELSLLTEHDNLITKKFFTPKMMTPADIDRLWHLNETIIPALYKKLNYN